MTFAIFSLIHFIIEFSSYVSERLLLTYQSNVVSATKENKIKGSSARF